MNRYMKTFYHMRKFFWTGICEIDSHLSELFVNCVKQVDEPSPPTINGTYEMEQRNIFFSTGLLLKPTEVVTRSYTGS